MTKTESWQPIETAPKDGTPILLFDGRMDDDPYGPICVSHWYVIDGFEWEPVEGTDFYRKAKTEPMCGWAAGNHPSHWMPLPDAPSLPHEPGQQPREPIYPPQGDYQRSITDSEDAPR